MLQPWLIQTGKLKNTQGILNPSVDDSIQFEYMGSAEFEFGALPKSLKRICKNLDSYIISKLSTKAFNGCSFMLIHNPSRVSLEDVQEFVDNQIGKNPARLKERSEIKEAVTGKGSFGDRRLEAREMKDIWWDIDNDFWIVLGEKNAVKILDAFKVVREKKRISNAEGWF